jgi:hypothetical protein
MTARVAQQPTSGAVPGPRPPVGSGQPILARQDREFVTGAHRASTADAGAMWATAR